MALATDRLLIVVDASSKGALQEMDKLQREAKRSADAFDTLGKKVGLAGNTIKAGLAAGAGAFLGVGLVSFLNDSVNAFAEAQKSAALFSQAMNTSGENAGKLTSYLRTLGLDQNDLIEINAEFSKSLKDQKGTLDQLGVTLKKNKDGTIDTADAFVEVVDALRGVEDGAKRSQIALQFFGEEGAKQIAPLIFGSKNLKDTLEDMEFVYDPKRAQDYAAAQQDLNLAFDRLQQTIGQALIPAFTTAARAGTDLIDFFTTLPGPVVDFGLAIAGAVTTLFAFKKATEFFNSATFGKLFVGALDTIGKIPDAFFAAEGAANKAKVGVTLFGGAMRAAATAAGPFLALVVAFEALNNALTANSRTTATLSNFKNVGKDIAGLAVELEKTDGWLDSILSWDLSDLWNDVDTVDMDRVIDNYRLRAEATLASAEATDVERQAAENLLAVLDRGTKNQWFNPDGDVAAGIRRNNAATEEGTAAFAQYENAIAGAAGQMEEASAKQTQLADLIAEGVTSGEEFSEALNRAGEAAAETARNQDILNRAMEAYNGVTSNSIEITAQYYDTAYAAEAAMRALQSAVEAYNAEPSPEGLQDVIDSARSAADAAATAWQVAQTRLGIYVSESEVSAQRVAAIKWIVAQPGFPPGAAAKLALEAAQITAAATRESGFKIPVGYKQEDIDTALATIAAQLADPNISPDLRAQLLLDQQSLQNTKDNITNLGVDAATEVKVDANTAEAESAIDGVTGDKQATVTVNTEFSPGGYEAVKARKDFLLQQRNSEIDIDVEFGPGGYNAVKARKDFVVQDRRANIVVNVDFQPGSYVDILKRINTIATNRSATITLTTVTRRVTVEEEEPAALSNRRLALKSFEQRGGARIALPKWEPQRPINWVSVGIDGRQLRSVVAEEFGAELDAARVRARIGEVA